MNRIPKIYWKGPLLNPFTKFAICLGVSSLTIGAQNEASLYTGILVAAVISLCTRGRKKSLIAIIWVFGLCGLDIVARSFLMHGPGLLLAGFLHTFVRMGPPVLLGLWLSRTIRVSDLLSSLETIHCPKSFSIALAVALRFLPTISGESALIKSAMITRGISRGIIGNCLHPVRAIEEHMVPIMTRSMQVADELTVSALTRGLQHTGRRSSARPPRFGILDALIIVGMTTCIVIFLGASNNV